MSKKFIPTKKQLEFMDWEFGMFFHFGIRSFFPGHDDWDGFPMPASEFNPKHLDCASWIRAAKNAGAKYAILVTKHHDGFANWPSKYSDYSVAQSPWKNGTGDVVREFTDACRLYNLKVGLYYSPAQWGGTVKFDNAEEYDEYFISQISELLTNYGEIDYLWFDGCGSENHEYDMKRIIHTIRTLQPGIRLIGKWDPDTRWIGNEDGYADSPNLNVVERVEFSMFAKEQEDLGSVRYLPAECDMRMRTYTWFDCSSNADTVKSVEELMGIYEYSVGRGANLLLNIGPNSDGLLPPEDAKRLKEFGEALKRKYGTPLAFGKPEKISETSYIIKTEEAMNERNEAEIGNCFVDTVVLQEDLTNGESVLSFRLYAALPGYSEKEICIFSGDNIGHKRICRFPLVKTGTLRLEITESDGEVLMRDFKAYGENAAVWYGGRAAE